MESKRLQKFYVKLYIEAKKTEINITQLKKKFLRRNWKRINIR